MNTIIRNEVELKTVEKKLAEANKRIKGLEGVTPVTLTAKQKQEATLKRLKADVLEYQRQIADYTRE
jgi:hypothetical protein